MKKYLIIAAILVIFIITLTGCSSKNKVEGNYILNTDGYINAEVIKLAHDTYEIYLVGIREYKSICWRYMGTIEDKKGVFEGNNGKIEVSFEEPEKMIISTDSEKYKLLAGTYAIDNGKTDKIVSSKKTELDGYYTNGIIFGWRISN